MLKHVCADDDFATMLELEDELLGMEDEPRKGSTVQLSAPNAVPQGISAPSLAIAEEILPHKQSTSHSAAISAPEEANRASRN